MRLLTEQTKLRPLVFRQPYPKQQREPSLVLYLPLWNMGEGSSYISLDAYGHSVTKTGITMTGQGGWSFNGTSDLASIPNANSLSLASTFTLSAWVKPSGVSGYQTIIDKYFGSARDDYMLTINDDNLEAHIDDGASNVAYSKADIMTTEWQFVAVTFDGNNVVLFRNGVDVLTTARTTALSTSTEVVKVGSDSAWGRYFGGRIGEVSIYNRALTPREILNRYVATKGNFGG